VDWHALCASSLGSGGGVRLFGVGARRFWLPGQVLLFRMRDGAVAKHLGLMAADGPRPTFIHAYTGHGVIESPLSDPWRRRVAARFMMTKE